MSLKRSAVESVVRLAACFARNSKGPPVSPRSIFVLRNNDMGDLLIVTPIFEALKKCFPAAQIIAGTGRWNIPVLLHNPYIDQIVEINAPWHNKFVCQVPHRSMAGLWHSLSYMWHSSEAKKLKTLGCDIGIDVLGSPEGSLLMMRAGIPWRLGVNGYAGGHSACQQTVPYDETIQVGRAALRFAEVLGATSLPEPHPQIFLTQQEKSQAAETWLGLNNSGAGKFKRILIAPGGGVQRKCWPRENYRSLTASLASQSNVEMVIVGSQADYELGEYVRSGSAGVANLCGKTSLRETFALAWASDGVACNSSMIMHAAAAFDKPTIVFLGETFDSAQKHKLLWGYGANDLHLGREPERNRVFTPAEAMPIVSSHFGLRDPSSVQSLFSVG